MVHSAVESGVAGAAWDRYVDAHPDASIAHLEAWGDVVRDVYGHRCHRLVAQRGERLVGVLPLVEV